MERAQVDAGRAPVVIAVGQAVARAGDEPVSPLTLIERAARAALDEAPGIDRRIDRISVVNILNGGGKAPASLLARRLGCSPARTETTTIGGNTPQWLVTRAAEAIAAGEGATTLIAGGEAVRSQHEQPSLGHDADDIDVVDDVVGDERPGLGAAELAAGLMVPAHVYPVFESVVAHHAGRSLAEHRQALGRLMSPFTRVASGHPFAWFREELEADDIATPTDDNRLVAEPYTKRMNAFIAVDQAAVVVVTSLAVARELGLDERAVFIHSGADACDVWFPAERPDLGASPGIRAAGEAALAAAGCDVDEIDAFDLYSCFPVAVELACAALGIAENDPRGLTVTGGLPYFGGAGNNYTTHAIATAVDRLRERPGRALVGGLGWFVTKHAVGVYGSAPSESGFRRGETASAQGAIDASALPLAGDLGSRPTLATVDGGTVVYERDGGVRQAPVIATLADGRRVVAAADRGERDDLAGVNLAGATVSVDGNPPRYRVEELAEGSVRT